LDVLRVRGVEHDVTDNITSHTPQLGLTKLTQIIPVDEGHAAKETKTKL